MATRVAFLMFLACLPVALTAYPPIFDYPNHVSRAHVLATMDGGSVFADWFERASYLIPNVSTDLALVGLTHLVGAEAAGRVVLLVIVSATLSGALALGRTVTGRLEPWPAFVAIFLYNEMLHWGFLNYLLGLAGLLWGVTAWVWLGRRSRALQLLTAAVLAMLLLFCHLVAFGLFAVAVAAYEITDIALDPAMKPLEAARRRVAKRLALSASVFLPALAHHVALNAGGLPAAPLFNYHPFEKISPFTRLLSSGAPVTDAAVLIATLAVLGVLWRRGTIRVEPRLGAIAAAFAACLLVLPYSLMHSFFVDNRIATAVAFLALAGIQTRGGPAADRVGWAAVFVLASARTALVVLTWTAADREIKDMIAGLDQLPTGGLVISATAAPFEYGTGWFYTRTINPPHEHTASWATVRRDAIVPAMFAKAGQNPVVFSPPSAMLKAISLGPIHRTSSSAGQRALLFRAAKVRAELDQAGLPGQSLYVAAFGTTCKEWPSGLPLRPAVCGGAYSIVEVTRPRQGRSPVQP
ncbi:hypothetical protein [Chthonobacter rhizosphaerae]|uniref:hypothetical protein n=1 Tax=Chthonobacter rhizosphaerae TaxID=2735553 RepID=UPI0015EEC1D3|nr:hypothetical protein [Chthonobacter rhizosphaerae]